MELTQTNFDRTSVQNGYWKNAEQICALWIEWKPRKTLWNVEWEQAQLPTLWVQQPADVRVFCSKFIGQHACLDSLFSSVLIDEAVSGETVACSSEW
jgi:hypothetical protein